MLIALLPFLGLIVPYLACGGLLWIIAHFLAPIGSVIPLSRGIAAVFVMGVFGMLSKMFLGPLIGEWRLLTDFAVDVLVVMCIFQLPLLRSVVAVVVYTVVVMIAVYFLFIQPKQTNRSSIISPACCTC